MDLFEKFAARAGTELAQLSRQIHGRAAFPKLTGDIGPRMVYQGQEHLIWSINNYLGLANHPEVRRVDAEAAARYGLASPMGSRMMSGETDELELLEAELAGYARKPDAFFLNFGFPGMVSLIDELLSRHDWLVYDAEAHACIADGVRLHMQRSKKVRSFPHNNIERLEQVLQNIDKVRRPDEGVLVVSEGVFGMSGVQGRLKEIVALKQKYNFRLLVDDAHGFGVLGPNGGGTGEEQGVQDEIDLYFATFAKAGASVGAFVASRQDVIWQLRYGMRSQIFSKGLPTPVVVGNRERLRLMRTEPWRREHCLATAKALRENLRANGFEVGNPESAITPVFLVLARERVLPFVYRLRDHYRVFCSVVIYPVVPPGVIQLRLISTADHTVEDAKATVAAITDALWEVNADQDLVEAVAADR
jgi:glycine C-acetyltransferase